MCRPRVSKNHGAIGRAIAGVKIANSLLGSRPPAAEVMRNHADASHGTGRSARFCVRGEWLQADTGRSWRHRLSVVVASAQAVVARWPAPKAWEGRREAFISKLRSVIRAPALTRRERRPYPCGMRPPWPRRGRFHALAPRGTALVATTRRDVARRFRQRSFQRWCGEGEFVNHDRRGVGLRVHLNWLGRRWTARRHRRRRAMLLDASGSIPWELLQGPI